MAKALQALNMGRITVIIGILLVQLMLFNTINTVASVLSNNATNEQLAAKYNTMTTTAPTTTSTTTTTPSSSSSSASPPTTTTTTTETTTTTTSPTTTTWSAEPPTQSAMREPSEQEINEARKIIHEIASTIKEGAARATHNKPGQNQLQDFAPESPEARVASAATQFGLNFINSLPDGPRDNVVVSPVSLQILLNIILLGTNHQSPTEIELARTLGYETNCSFQVTAASNNESTTTTSKNNSSPACEVGQPSQSDARVTPHAAMHSLLESISHATHLTDNEQQQQQQLLNSNPQLAAVLQTSARDIGTPLTGQVNFTLANLLLTNNDLLTTNRDYEMDLKRFYDVKLERFSKSNTSATSNKTLHERVNSWVKAVTQNQISELVSQADLEGDDLAMILLNAANFKGRWLHTFNTKLTQERLFYNEGQETGGQEVKFMRQNGVFGYAEFGGGGGNGEQQGTAQHTSTSDETVLTEDLAAGRDNEMTSSQTGQALPSQLLQPPTIELSKEEAKRYELTSILNCSVLMMPFALNDGQELSMVVLLPNKRDGLNELLKNLNGPALNEIYRALNEQHVQVELPKFSFESSLDAKSTLQKMGITKLFQTGVDLGRMLSDSTPKTQVKVDKVVHKAKIAVDELGAEAAAASAATIVLRNLIRPPNPTFVADHPFIFIIRHNRSNLPLFMGTIQRL